MDKEVVVHIHNRLLLSHKRECLLVSSNEVMNLEPIIQSEVSQKEKDKYRILSHIYRSRKMVLKNLLTGQQWRNRHREETYGHGERGEEGEMYGKSNMETYIEFSSVQSLSRVQLFATPRIAARQASLMLLVLNLSAWILKYL